MGCILSSMDEDGRVGICKERKKAMKQLVGIREEFSYSLLAYLRALRNTGATLRQFTESDTLETEIASNGLAELLSPPLNQLPPRPPPPSFPADKSMAQVAQHEMPEYDDNSVPMPQIDPSTNSSLLFQPTDKNEIVESSEEENRQETGGRNGKTLEGIVIELDDYFLKASTCIKEIAVLIDDSAGDTLLRQNSGRHNSKRGNSAKVFSVLSWSRYSKSPQFTKDATDFSGSSEPCRPGAHCATLKKLYAAEKKLFKAVKGEGIAKLEFERKSLLLQKQEDENIDLVKIDKTRSCVEKLESDLISLRQCISETTSSILELIDGELLPQLVALTAGLAQMWRTMHECHQAQARISQQLSNLSDNHNTILNSEYHHQATIQFETEASYWYNSFCKVLKSQQEYVRTLCRWIQHTNCLRDGHEDGNHSSISTICEQWELGLDGLPDKEVSDAIKSLLLSIRDIIAQQAEEDNILKRLEKLERKLQKYSNSLAEMQKKIECSFEDDGDIANMSPRHPLYLKKAETEALKKQVESVKANYLDSVQFSRVMTLNNLKTKLPHLFRSLMEFSGASVQAIEGIHTESDQ